MADNARGRVLPGTGNLQVWAAAKGDVVLCVQAVCAEHAAWTRDPDFTLPPGVRMYRVKSKALIRRLLSRPDGHPASCTECAFRAGKVIRFADAGPLGAIRLQEVTVPGGEA